jgi:hypothetical protein
MKRMKTKLITANDDAAEYDFRKMKNLGRGRYFRDLQQGYSITIQHADGSTEVRQVPPAKNVIVLDPDVQTYFPNSEVVNQVLRSLIALIPQKQTHTSIE